MRLAILSFAVAAGLLVNNLAKAQYPMGKPGYAPQNPATQPQSPTTQPGYAGQNATARPANAQAVPFRRFGPGSFNKQAAIGAYGRAVYPKYTWGFHSRDLQNIGVPHGDIGTLGSGLSRDPW